MFLPKIIVKKIEPKKNVELIYELAQTVIKNTNNSLAFSERLCGRFPAFKDKFKPSLSDAEIYQIVDYEIKKELIESNEALEARVIEIQEKFNEIERPLLQSMLSLFEVEWSVSGPNIICYLGCLPVFPRDVITKEFWINYYSIEEKIMGGAIHEINHFVFFEKWKSMHGYTKTTEPTHPEALWFLEEIIVGPTLADQRIQSVFPNSQKSYASFYREKINNRFIMDYIEEFYNNRVSMEDFLNRCYEFITDNIEEIILKCG